MANRFAGNSHCICQWHDEWRLRGLDKLVGSRLVGDHVSRTHFVLPRNRHLGNSDSHESCGLHGRWRKQVLRCTSARKRHMDGSVACDRQSGQRSNNIEYTHVHRELFSTSSLGSYDQCPNWFGLFLRSGVVGNDQCHGRYKSGAHTGRWASRGIRDTNTYWSCVGLEWVDCDRNCNIEQW